MTSRYTVKGLLAGARRRLTRPFLARRARALHHRTLRELLAGSIRANRLLFVCYGNICRSPFAEKLVANQARSIGVESAGFHASTGRSSPQNMQFAARQLGIELSDWRSSRVTDERVRTADLVILFDLHNFALYEQAYGRRHAKVLMLGLLGDPPEIEISDPYGKGDEEALRIARQIQETAKELIALAEGALPRQSSRA